MGTADGAVTGVVYRDTYQKLLTKGAIDTTLQWAIWKKTPFMQAIGVEAFGSKAMSDFSAFGKRSESGQMVKHTGGSYISGSVFETDGTSQHVGRLGSFTPELVEGGDEWAYAHQRLFSAQFIPDIDVQDNAGSGKIIDIKTQKMEAMKGTIARDLNNSILGNSSAPDYDVKGPSLMKSSLNYWLGVSDVTVGNIIQTATGGDSNSTEYWSPQRKAITSLGGGGDLDRPITMRRSLMKVMNDAIAFAEAMNKYLLVTTQGGWQYFDRLFYADAVNAQRDGALGKKGNYDAAGVEHKVFNGNPIVWDPNCPVPNGATASTEAIYGIHTPDYWIDFHKEEGLTLEGWEGPRLHDQQRTEVAQFRVRYTPVIKAMRSHFLAYNMPANAD